MPTLADAQHPYPYLETFDHDTDTYEPNADPLNDPDLDGAPPGDWSDIRTGAEGIIEEVPSGYLGVPASHGNHLGLIYPQGNEGPAHNSGSSLTPPATPLAFRVDLYVDPAMPSAIAPGTGQDLGDGRPGIYGSDGLPDFWWDSAVQLKNVGGLLTSTGFSGEVLDDGAGTRFWRFAPLEDDAHGVDVPVGRWVTMEVVYDASATRLAATRKVWNQRHTELLFSSTITEMFSSPDSVDMGGAYYSWFTQIQSNGVAYPGIDRNVSKLFVDDAGVATPIVQIVLGDMDGDGDLDNFDIGGFELALTNPDAYLAAHPALTDFNYRGDIDGDNSFSNFDIGPFEQRLATSSAQSPVAVPEPSARLLAGWGLITVAGCRIGRRRRAL